MTVDVAAPRPRRPPGRARTVLGALAAGALLLAAAAPTWVTATLADPLGGPAQPLAVPGGSAAPAVPALGLVALAAAAALSTVRGPLLRLTAAIIALAGAGAAASTVLLLRDPAAAVAAAAREAAGTTGASAAAVEPALWPWVALAPAAGLVLAGLRALARGPAWATTARFEPPAGARAAAPSPPATAPAPPGRSRLWDSLSEGDDPTAGPPGP